MKQTLKPWFEMNPTTEMVDEGKEHAKTEDPHEDVGKLEKDGDKAVVMIGLKDLCAQLHHAADSYQSSFLSSNQKQLVIKDTKEYVCRALVTVVDHLGYVSAKLDQHLSKVDSIYQTDAKLSLLNLVTISDVLKQNESFSEPKCGKVAKSVNEKHEFKVDEEVPLFLYTCNRYKPSSLLEASKSVVPVRDNLALQPKSEFFQLPDKSKSRRGLLFMKSRRYNEIFSVGGSRRICH
ncbi:probable protein ABIL5 isoform X2 [Tanacetum coccineum]